MAGGRDRTCCLLVEGRLSANELKATCPKPNQSGLYRNFCPTKHTHIVTCGPGGVAKAREGQVVGEGEKERSGENCVAGAIFLET